MNINPKSRQRQLRSSCIKTLSESKNVKTITIHCLEQLVQIHTKRHIKNFLKHQDGDFSQNSQGFPVMNYFCKKLHQRSLVGFLTYVMR